MRLVPFSFVGGSGEPGSGGGGIVYASVLGAALDGVTDDTAILQAALDDNDVVEVDGDCMWDTLYLNSNNTLRLPGFTYTKKPAPNSGTCFIKNKNVVLGPATPTDSNITIYAPGATIDGNRRNGGGGNPPGTGPILAPNEAYNVFCNTNAEIVPTIGMYGVAGFTFTGDVGDPFTIHDSPSFGIHLANVQDYTIQQFHKTLAVADTVPANDGLHVNGWCTDGVAEDLDIETNDDMVAYCADDGDDLAPGTQPFTFEANHVASGPITNCVSRRLHLAAGTTNAGIVRYLSAKREHYIDNCNVEDTTAAFTVLKPIYFDNFGVTGLGDYRRVTLTGMGHECSVGQVHIKNAFVRRLIVDDLSTTGSTNAIVVLELAGTSICAELEIKNSTATNTDYLVDVTGGAVLNTFARSGNTTAGLIAETNGAINNALAASLTTPALLFEDTFTGSAGTALVGHAPDTGTTWAGGAGDAYQGPPVSDIKLDGNGFVYNGLGATGSSLILNPATFSGNAWVVGSRFKFISSVASTNACVALFTPPGAAADSRFVYSTTTTGWQLTNAPVDLPETEGLAFPTGLEYDVRLTVFNGTARYVFAEVSDDDGDTWQVLFGGLVTFTDDANAFRPGLWFDGNVGASTGVHPGNLRVGTVTQF